MNEKQDLDSFVSDIDKIISGESIVLEDKEYDELLKLAQFLAKADFHPPSPSMKKKIWEIMSKKGELEDDDLDMVAGGLNLNHIIDEKDKKKGM
jgi:hypothetical protein